MGSEASEEMEFCMAVCPYQTVGSLTQVVKGAVNGAYRLVHLGCMLA